MIDEKVPNVGSEAKATIVVNNKEYHVRAGISVRKAIREIGFVSGNFLPIQKGQLLPDDYVLKKSDRIELLNIVSGG